MATTPCAAPAERRTATTFPGAFAYEHTDIPPGMTIDEYRRERGASRCAEHERRRVERRRALLRPVFAIGSWFTPARVAVPRR